MSPVALLRQISWVQVVAIFIALGLGWLVAGRIKPGANAPLKADDPVLLRDLRVIDQLSLYVPVDSLEFLEAIDKSGKFNSDLGP